jgi:hypothetical protein
MYAAYRNDPEFMRVDAVVFFHLPSLAEAYMALNKSLVIVSSTRFELGRLAPDRMQRLVNNLRRIASSPFNTIAANNKYDQEFLKYFTGLDVELIPSYCGYSGVTYQPTKTEFLIGGR